MTLFAKPKPTPKIPKTETPVPVVEVIHLIDRKKSQNIEIMLKGLRLEFHEIRDAIFNIDDQVLDLERLSNIERLAPSKSEAEILLNYDGDTSLLGEAERYLLTLLSIPRLSSRLHTMVFRRRFQEEINYIEKDAKVVLEAIQEILNSKTFLEVLQTVLVIGNFLNGTSFRGNASGFRIESLLTLKDTKKTKEDKNEPATLLHYVAKALVQSGKRAIELVNEMPTAETVASSINISILLSGIDSLANGLENLKVEINEHKPYPGDPLIPKFIVLLIDLEIH